VKTLITAANSAKAYSLKNSLADQEIVLGDYMDLPSFMLNQENMVKLPNPKLIAYAHQMLTLCLNMQIDTLYALRKDEQIHLNEARQLFEEYGIEIVSCE